MYILMIFRLFIIYDIVFVVALGLKLVLIRTSKVYWIRAFVSSQRTFEHEANKFNCLE
jgi:hypothetical protein